MGRDGAVTQLIDSVGDENHGRKQTEMGGQRVAPMGGWVGGGCGGSRGIIGFM